MPYRFINQHETVLLDKISTEDKIEIAENGRFTLCADEVNDIINLSIWETPVEIIQEFGPELYDTLFNAILKTAKFLEERND